MTDAVAVVAEVVKPAEVAVTPPAVPAVVAPVVPAEPAELVYALKAPDGYDVAEFEAVAKANKISPETAQVLLDREAKSQVALHAAFLAKQAEDSKALAGEWLKQTKADPQIGGQQFADVSARAAAVVQRFGSAEMRRVLNESGLGNHPEWVRFCTSISKATTSDQIPVARPAGDQPARDDRAILYPSMK